MKDNPPSILAHLGAANVVTTLGAACGLAAIVLTVRGNHSGALTALMCAVLFDRLDGMVARRLGQSSDFGRELDSLADSVSFLLAPAAIVALLSQGHALACVATGVFVLAGVWRLAHFNLTGMAQVDGRPVFRGLPTTIAGAWFIIAWAALRVSPVSERVVPLLLAALMLATAPLMLSRAPVRKDGWLVKSLYLLLPPTLLATWWPA